MGNRKIAGLTIAGLAVVLMVGMGWIGSWSVSGAARAMTMAEMEDTTWSPNRFPFWLWVFSVPAGAIVAVIGVFLAAGVPASRIAIFGGGTLGLSALIQFLPQSSHAPPVFGVTGGIILASFLSILWSWMKKRPHLKGRVAAAADLRLAGFVLLVTAMWYLCGILGAPFLLAFAPSEPQSPLAVILFLGVAWCLMAVSHVLEMGDD